MFLNLKDNVYIIQFFNYMFMYSLSSDDSDFVGTINVVILIKYLTNT